MITMPGPVAGEKGGAKAGSLLLGFIPLGVFGQVEALIFSSQTPEVLIYLPPEFLVDRVRLVCIVKRERFTYCPSNICIVGFPKVQRYKWHIAKLHNILTSRLLCKVSNLVSHKNSFQRSPETQNRKISTDTKPACHFLSSLFSVYTQETCRIKQTTIRANVTKYPSFETNPSHFCSKTDDTLEQTEELCVHKWDWAPAKPVFTILM